MAKEVISQSLGKLQEMPVHPSSPWSPESNPYLLPDGTTVFLTPRQTSVLSVLVERWKKAQAGEGENCVMMGTLLDAYMPLDQRRIGTAQNLRSKFIPGLREILKPTNYCIDNLTTPDMRIRGKPGGYAFREKQPNSNKSY